jgi:hypothetical protein
MLDYAAIMTQSCIFFKGIPRLIPNHKPVNANDGSPIILILAAVPRLHARVQPLK